jgi:Holliday junction resolvase RusA-like endonuclease
MTTDIPFLPPMDGEWIEFTIPGEIVPWARAGAMGKRRFTPKKQSDYMGTIRLFGSHSMAARPVIRAPMELDVLAVYAMPASWPKKRQRDPLSVWKTSAPDGDNLVKIVKDSLNMVVWYDDAQIARMTVTKRYGDIPRLVVRYRVLVSGDA